MKCDMHDFWVHVYDLSQHWHRDPVANVVIYSSFAFFGAALALIFGAPAYVVLAETDPCLGFDENGVHVTGLDSCHLVMGFSLAIYTLLVACIGIAAGEKHTPLLYSVFGGLGFVAFWAEVYSFSATITQIVQAVPRAQISASTYPDLVFGLGGVAIAGHFFAMVGIFMAVRYAWLVNFHFTRQDKLIYADQVRQRKGMAAEGMDLGVADIDDDYDFNIGGMKKGIHKMLTEKQKAIKQESKKAAQAAIDAEEDRRIAEERKVNIF